MGFDWPGLVLHNHRHPVRSSKLQNRGVRFLPLWEENLSSLGEDVEELQNDISEGATGIKQTLFAIIDLAATGKNVAQLYVQTERLNHYLGQIQRGCKKLRVSNSISNHMKLLDKCSKLFVALDCVSDLKVAWERGEEMADIQGQMKMAQGMLAQGGQVKIAVEWFLRKAEDFNAYHCCAGLRHRLFEEGVRGVPRRHRIARRLG